LLSGECCSIPVYANALTAMCKGCDVEVPLRINPRIVGQVLDETAAIGCGKLLFSDEAWSELLGRRPGDVLQLGYRELKELSDRILFTRVSVLFGWTSDETQAGGRICVMGIEGWGEFWLVGIFYLRCARNWEVLISFYHWYLLFKYSQYNNSSTLVLYTILFLRSKSISRV